MKRVILIVLSTFLLSLSGYSINRHHTKSDSIILSYTDSLAQLKQKYSNPTSEEYNPNPYLYRLTTTPTYYTSPIKSVFDLEAKQSPLDSVTNRVLLRSYLSNPSYYKMTEDRLLQVKNAYNQDAKTETPKIEVVHLVKVDKPTEEIGLSDPIAQRPNFWKYKANTYLQFSQSYVSGNWYKGGESSNTLLTGLTLEANYDDQKRLEWENKAELKVGFVSSRADSLHKYKTNNDLFRLSTKLGYKAIKNWYYTVLAEVNNQFFPGYKTNDRTVYSNFLAPLKFNASLGMDFKKKVDKKYEISLALLPASYNFVYVGNDGVDVTLFGIEEGRCTLNKIGSKLQVDHTWYLLPQITWKSHFYLFTSYNNTEAQWENTFDFAVNKFLSAKVFVNARFDDAVTRTSGYSYFQIQELLSFGLSYTL